MPNITYVQPDGTTRMVEVEVGRTVKDGAINNLVPGIIAECGGACSCATCHVYVGEEWVGETGVAGEDEADMLDFALDVTANSRLSCQITVMEALNGLVVHVPEEQ